MSSRAAPSIRSVKQPRRFFGKSIGRLPSDPINRDPPALDKHERNRKMVCRRCGLVMSDCEPMIWEGEFWHIAAPHQTRAAVCINANSYFGVTSPEVTPFMVKARRRALKRFGIRP